MGQPAQIFTLNISIFSILERDQIYPKKYSWQFQFFFYEKFQELAFSAKQWLPSLYLWYFQKWTILSWSYFLLKRKTSTRVLGTKDVENKPFLENQHQSNRLYDNFSPLLLSLLYINCSIPLILNKQIFTIHRDTLVFESRVTISVKKIHHKSLTVFLTHSWRRSLSYRNQSIDLLCKTMDWLLYHRDLCHERVKFTSDYLVVYYLEFIFS